MRDPTATCRTPFVPSPSLLAQRDGSDTNVKYIAHGSLPEGIPEITTPNHILADVENANKNDNSDGPTTAKTLRINHQGGKE